MVECPQHHQSETSDYCSVCGTQIVAAAAEAPVVAAAGTHCPQCNAARDSEQQIFCEVCGYNFRTAQPGASVPIPAPASVAAASATPAPTIPPDPVATVKRWDVIVSVDANLYGQPSTDAPVDKPEQTFTLFEKENILGRATPGFRLQIPIAQDAGVSRRHAVFTRAPAGLSVRDLGSANGTQVNGTEIVAGVEMPLKDRDVLGVGAWTRITIKAIQA